MPDQFYNIYKDKLLKGEINHTADTLKCMLVDSTYSPDIDNHQFISDVSGEITGTGYAAGGQQLANVVVNVDNNNDVAIVDFDDVIWTNATFIARGAIIYKDTGDPSSSPLVCYLDFGTDREVDGVDFILRINSQGFIQL